MTLMDFSEMLVATGVGLRGVLDLPLLSLAGGTLTPGKILLGMAIIFVAFRLAKRLSRQLMELLSKRGMPEGSQFAIAKMVRYLLVLVGVLVAANSVGINLDAILAASTVLAVGIGFGLQNIAQNFISGLILLVEQPVSKGDFVRVGDSLGVVEDVGLRATRIVTRDSVAILVPNSQFIAQPVINHSRPSSDLRTSVKVGVAYGTDTARVREVLMKVAASHAAVLTEPPPEVLFTEFGASSIDFTLLAWISDPSEDYRVASDLRYAIHTAFAREGIEIPFPQRDLRIRPTPGASPIAGSNPIESSP